jgi:hypothetical protein
MINTILNWNITVVALFDKTTVPTNYPFFNKKNNKKLGEVTGIKLSRKSYRRAVRRSEAVRDLNGVKPNERIVECSLVKLGPLTPNDFRRRAEGFNSGVKGLNGNNWCLLVQRSGLKV